MGRVRDPKQHGVRRFRRPAGEIGGAEIGGVELGPGDLGDAVDAAHPGSGRVPACRPGSVSRAANPGSLAIARRDTLSAMPLAIANLTNSRREVLMLPTIWSSPL